MEWRECTVCSSYLVSDEGDIKHKQTLDDVITEYESRQKGSVNGRHSYRKCEPTLEEEINWWKSSYVRK